jgi:hypothetical protein
MSKKRKRNPRQRLFATTVGEAPGGHPWGKLREPSILGRKLPGKFAVDPLTQPFKARASVQSKARARKRSQGYASDEIDRLVPWAKR